MYNGFYSSDIWAVCHSEVHGRIRPGMHSANFVSPQTFTSLTGNRATGLTPAMEFSERGDQ